MYHMLCWHLAFLLLVGVGGFCGCDKKELPTIDVEGSLDVLIEQKGWNEGLNVSGGENSFVLKGISCSEKHVDEHTLRFVAITEALGAWAEMMKSEITTAGGELGDDHDITAEAGIKVGGLGVNVKKIVHRSGGVDDSENSVFVTRLALTIGGKCVVDAKITEGEKLDVCYRVNHDLTLPAIESALLKGGYVMKVEGEKFGVDNTGANVYGVVLTLKSTK